MSNGRKTNGQFANGNKFALGRPKRAIELEYLRALSDAVPIETWQTICARAVDDARNGDDKAREWLAKHLIGAGATLSELARLDVLNATPGDAIVAAVQIELNPPKSISDLLQNEYGEKRNAAQILAELHAQRIDGD